jgi:transposase
LVRVLFVGNDWAEGHHDIELEDEGGRRLSRARLPEGLEGIARLHALVALHAPPDWADLPPEQVAGRVVVGIETDRGPWVTALRAAGYQVFAINPLSVARYRERHSASGAKSDAGDAHVLAELVRLDRDHHRPIAGDSELADAIKLLARAHQTAIWERTRHVLRLRSALLEFFPAAVEAFDDLASADDRRATSTGEKRLVNVHAKSRLTPEPLRALRSETKGQAGACPDRTRAIPCKVRVGLLPDGLRRVGSNGDSNSSDQRQAAATGDSAQRSYDP